MYKIREISTLKGSDHTYVLVDYLDATGTVVECTEEHIMQLATHDWLTDKDGNFALVDGSWIAPDKMEEGVEYKRVLVEIPVAPQIEANCRKFDEETRHRLKWTGDHTGDSSKPGYVDGILKPQGHQIFERDTSDPKGILSRADVAALVVADVVAKP